MAVLRAKLSLLLRHVGNQAVGWAHSAILISKMVLPTVNLGPPTYTVDRTIFELWLGGL